MKNSKKLAAVLGKMDSILLKIEDAITMVCMSGMVIVVLVGIVFRFLLKIPNPYGEEISRYLMIATVFIGISIAAHDRAHLGIDTLVSALPAKLGKAIRIFTDMLSIALYLFLAVQSWSFCGMAKQFGQMSPSMNFLPMYLVYTLLLIGFILSAITQTLLFINDHICTHPFIVNTAYEAQSDSEHGKEA